MPAFWDEEQKYAQVCIDVAQVCQEINGMLFNLFPQTQQRCCNYGSQTPVRKLSYDY
jgi:hypothetical protein